MEIEGIRDAKLYSVKEVTELVGLHENTVYSEIHSGRLKAIRPRDRSKWRIAGKFIKEWLKGDK